MLAGAQKGAQPTSDALQRAFALKLNKYLPGLERVFQDYAIEASSRLGLNNFIRFLKEYQLLAKTEEEKGAEGYERVTIERAQIVFKQTIK